jgi:hypothetical protein
VIIILQNYNSLNGDGKIDLLAEVVGPDGQKQRKILIFE